MFYPFPFPHKIIVNNSLIYSWKLLPKSGKRAKVIGASPHLNWLGLPLNCCQREKRVGKASSQSQRFDHLMGRMCSVFWFEQFNFSSSICSLTTFVRILNIFMVSTSNSFPHFRAWLQQIEQHWRRSSTMSSLTAHWRSCKRSTTKSSPKRLTRWCIQVVQQSRERTDSASMG